MTKAALDSDIYADIYGDPETVFTEEVTEEVLEEPELSQQGAISEGTEVDAQAIEVSELTENLNQDTHRSLPAKPTGSSSAQLSYSAQVAKQFSAYQQTPSQERQQQQNPRSGQGRPLSSPSEYKAVPGTSIDTVFGKKPSEMHDSG